MNDAAKRARRSGEVRSDRASNLSRFVGAGGFVRFRLANLRAAA
jgi:hypothetical protein